MTTTRHESETALQFNQTFLSEQMNRVIDAIIPQFTRALNRHVLFHLSFFALGFAEVFLFLYFFNAIADSSMIAITLGAMFLSLFSYFIMKLYFQSEKEEQFLRIKQRYLRGCKELMQYQSGVPEHHIALANGCTRLASRLERREYNHFRPPAWFGFMAPLLRLISWWCCWEDYHRIREMFLKLAVAEHIELVRIEPTNLEVHASLANAYVMLSSIYDPDEELALSGEKRKELHEKFRLTANQAIEEFKILSSFAPEDPWVHTQLAYSYHDLQMPEEEIREYEIIHRLDPQDLESLYKLGALYFQQGRNAEGLAVYEQLSRSSYQKAESLIRLYGKS